MRHLKAIILFIAATIACPASAGATDAAYLILQTKAERFLKQREWASAAAMYGLMVDSKPAIAANYGKLVVSETLAGDTLGVISTMRGALDHGVAFDSIYNEVRTVSFSFGKTDLYEQFLKRVKGGFPWLKRSIDAYLLDYYIFRRNGAEMVSTGQRLLEGMEGNINFLTAIAEGYLIEGKADESMATFRQILEYDPSNINALLYLGNFYAERAFSDEGTFEDRELALTCLLRAQANNPTPYVSNLIEQLNSM